MRTAQLSAKIIVVKRYSGFARQIYQRQAKSNQGRHKQESNTVFVSKIIVGTAEGDDDDQRGQYCRQDGTAESPVQQLHPALKTRQVRLQMGPRGIVILDCVNIACPVDHPIYLGRTAPR